MALEIINNRLQGPRVSFVPAPDSNVGGRIEPSLIIIHTTDGHLRKGGTVDYFRSDECVGKKTSCHFVVEYDGDIIQMVETDVKANHCGESTWGGRRYVNGFADGIEVVNPGQLTAPDSDGNCFHMDDTRRRNPYSKSKYGIRQDDKGKWWMPFSDRQVTAVTELCRALHTAHPTIKDIRGHFDISPGRKTDPGPLAPMDKFRAAVFSDVSPAPVASEDIKDYQRRLIELGYQVGTPDGFGGPRTRKEVRYFQEQNNLPITGEFDEDTVIALHSEIAKGAVVGSRDEWTAKDVAAQGSTTVVAGGNVKTVGLALKATSAGIVVGKVTEGVVDAVTSDPEKVLDTAERGLSLFKRLHLDSLFSSSMVLVALGLFLVGGLVYWFGKQIIDARVAAARRGQDTSKVGETA